MPNALVKSYAKETGKTVDHVEKWWDEAKESALKKFPKKGPRYWAYVNGIVERRGKLVHGKKKSGKKKTNEGIEETVFTKMSFREFLGETKGLTREQKQDLIDDFKEWSGGFTPNETDWDQIEEYVEHALDPNLDEEAARDFLHDYEDEVDD